VRLFRRSAEPCPVDPTERLVSPDRAEPMDGVRVEGTRVVGNCRCDLSRPSREFLDSDLLGEIEGSAGVTVCEPDDVSEPVDERVEDRV
jgi:hypothetical protein